MYTITKFKDQVVVDGIKFMQSITKAYGLDEGMKIWDKIMSECPDIKREIFFSLFVDDHRKLTIFSAKQDANGILLLKSLRSAWACSTGGILGLKEGKTMIDNLKDNNQPIELEFETHELKQRALDELIDAGFVL